MRILLVGATGTIGSAIATLLSSRGHEIVAAARADADMRVDLSSPSSVRDLYAAAGALDGVVCAAGVAKFGALEELTDADFDLGLRNKLMGQVNLVRFGIGTVREGGSFTLTSGDLSTSPSAGSAAVAAPGAALEAFARAAAIDLDGRYRVNVVSPRWVAESRVAMGLEPMPGIWARDLAEYYRRAVEGDATGQVAQASKPLD